MAKTDLTAALLRELLHYNPETGLFTWLKRSSAYFSAEMYAKTWNTKYAEKTAKGLSNGYKSIRVLDRAYLAHRLAWLYTHGSWPDGEVDHINGDKLDNRLVNLRDVSRAVNQQNLRTRVGPNKTLPLGVCKIHRDNLQKPYKATLSVSGVSKHLGYFASAEEAHDAYITLKRERHEGCTI